MPTPSSQGSSVSFDGQYLGRLTRFRVSPGAARFVESTSVNNTRQGSGYRTRVVATYDCVAIDPGTVEVTLYGCPPFTKEMIGHLGSLSTSWSGGGLSSQAYLESFDVTGQVGEFLVGQASFRLFY